MGKNLAVSSFKSGTQSESTKLFNLGIYIITFDSATWGSRFSLQNSVTT